MLEFWSSQIHRAKKEHKCSMCGETIKVGERYCRYSGKYDGEFFDEKQCLFCEAAIAQYFDDTGEREYDEDSIRQYLYDEYCSKCPCTNPEFEECITTELHCTRIREKLMERTGGNEQKG